MPDTAAPLVSIVIATYNRAHTLAEAIDSALGQQYPRVEVIVVDDGSSDTTQELLRTYGDRIIAHRQANAGYAAARNTGLRLARGKYVAWLDSDDLFLPEKTALQVAFMEAHDDVVLISSEFSAFDARGPRSDSVRTYYGVFGDERGPGSVFSASELLEPSGVPWLRGSTHPVVRVWSGGVVHQLLRGSFVHPPTVMLRRTAVEKAGPLDETLKNSVEYEFLFRLARFGAFAFVDYPLIRYRFSPDQFSGARHDDSMSLSILRILRDLPSTHPDVVVAAPALYRRRLAISHLYVARAFAQTDRRLAMRSAWQALRRGHVDRSMVNLCAQMLLPMTAVNSVRLLKRLALGEGTRRTTIVAHLADVFDILPGPLDLLARLVVA